MHASLKATLILGASTLLASCGFAPTSIGIDDPFSEPANSQLSALVQLSIGHTVVVAGIADPVCISFTQDYEGDYRGKNVYLGNCSVVTQSGTEAKAAQCRITMANETSLQRTFSLECARQDGSPCTSAREIGRITTPADLATIAANTTSVEDLEIVDASNPALKATLHDSSSCEDPFSTEGPVDAVR